VWRIGKLEIKPKKEMRNRFAFQNPTFVIPFSDLGLIPKLLNSMITRLSKIARLPAHIREQLNRRLHDGKLSNNILPWVNSLPETKEVLAELFNGKPITHQNLSEWRRAGYQDWLFHQQRLEWFTHFAEQSKDIQKHDACPDTFESMANVFLFEIFQGINVMKATKDPNQRCDRLQNLIREFSRLQNSYNFSRRIELDYVKHNSATGVSPVSPTLGAPAHVAPEHREGGSRRPGTVEPQPSEVFENRIALPIAGGASPSASTVLASRTPLETHAPETIEVAAESEPNSSTPKLLNSSTPAKCEPIPPLAPTPSHPQIHHPNIQPPAPPIPVTPTKSQYKVSAIPMRGRRFVCIEG
jgi:hypothetical protein